MSIPSIERVILGYAGAVAAATAINVFVSVTLRLASDSLNPLRPDRLAIVLILGMACYLVTALAAAGPCLVAERLAALLRIRPAWYFALWGTATGLGLGPCVVAMNEGFATDGGPPLPLLWVDRYMMTLPHSGPTFALSGIVGGLTYWWLSSRHPAPEPSCKLP